jgi:hypothetical protein
MKSHLIQKIITSTILGIFPFVSISCTDYDSLLKQQLKTATEKTERMQLEYEREKEILPKSSILELNKRIASDYSQKNSKYLKN